MSAQELVDAYNMAPAVGMRWTGGTNPAIQYRSTLAGTDYIWPKSSWLDRLSVKVKAEYWNTVSSLATLTDEATGASKAAAAIKHYEGGAAQAISKTANATTAALTGAASGIKWGAMLLILAGGALGIAYVVRAFR